MLNGVSPGNSPDFIELLMVDVKLNSSKFLWSSQTIYRQWILSLKNFKFDNGIFRYMYKRIEMIWFPVFSQSKKVYLHNYMYACIALNLHKVIFRRMSYESFDG